MAKKTTKKSSKKAAKKTTARAASVNTAVSPGDADEPSSDAAARTSAPLPLDHVLGQPRALAALDAALASGRVHHAWVFHGPAGVGKRTAALAFAAVLLDPTSRPDHAGRVRPDPESRVQTLLRAGVHPDLHLITKELARYSEDARVRDSKLVTIPKDVVETQLLRPATLAAAIAPGGLASKVFIVDDAELLDRSPTNAPVQNALLKTLEEPPDRTVIILVTSSEDRLLPTIRSRCQRVAFGPLDKNAMAAWTSAAGLETAIGVAEAPYVMRYAAGSPGRVLEAVEIGLARWARTIEPMLDAALAGRFVPDLGPAMADLVDTAAKKWADRDRNRSKEAANRASAARMLALVAEHARGRLAEDHAPALAAIDAVTLAEGRIAANVPLGLVFEGLAADLAAR